MNVSQAILCSVKIHDVYKTDRQFLEKSQDINKTLIEYLSEKEYSIFCRVVNKKMRDGHRPRKFPFRTFKRSFHKNPDDVNKGVWDKEIVITWGLTTLLLIIADIVCE